METGFVNTVQRNLTIEAENVHKTRQFAAFKGNGWIVYILSIDSQLLLRYNIPAWIAFGKIIPDS